MASPGSRRRRTSKPARLRLPAALTLHPRYPDPERSKAHQCQQPLRRGPSGCPDESEHEQVTRQEVRDEVDRDARRHFGLTADEFLRIYKDPPGRYHGNVIFRSLTYLARILDQPSQT